ncbi:M23 family metallopeptidase, partial [Embleya sp. NPDC001921]
PGAWPVCSVKAGLTRGGAAADVDTGSSAGKTAPKTNPKAKIENGTAPKAVPRKVEASAPKVVAAPEVEDKAAPRTVVADTPEIAPKTETAAKASYVVVAGDTLSRIADAQGVKGGWPVLFEANKGVVGGNPDLIFPGQKLAVDGSTAASTPKAAAPKAEVAVPKAETETDEAPKKETTAPKAWTSKTETTRKSSGLSTTTEKASGGFVSPVAGGSLSASFGSGGPRWSSGHHTGQDFAVSTGTTVRAVTWGTVVSAGWGGAYGNEVVIRHADGKYTQYAHLSSISVKGGTKVQPGQKVGLSGASGNVTGPHLHFEVRTTPNYGSAINPLNWLRTHGVNV